MNRLHPQFENQKFSNDYELVNGVEMHTENPENFQIPPAVIKRHIVPGQFVELRIDSPRFSLHEDAPEKCTCPSCDGELTKPILRHEHPATLMPLPHQDVPSRGWGEDFWVRVTERSECLFKGTIDNPLVESRRHGLNQGDELIFHADQILHVHDIHRPELVASMDETDLKELVRWIAESQDHRDEPSSFD